MYSHGASYKHADTPHVTLCRHTTCHVTQKHHVSHYADTPRVTLRRHTTCHVTQTHHVSRYAETRVTLRRHTTCHVMQTHHVSRYADTTCHVIQTHHVSRYKHTACLVSLIHTIHCCTAVSLDIHSFSVLQFLALSFPVRSCIHATFSYLSILFTPPSLLSLFDSLVTLLLFAYGLSFISHVATPVMENVQRRINVVKELGVYMLVQLVTLCLCTVFSADGSKGGLCLKHCDNDSCCTQLLLLNLFVGNMAN